MLRTAGLLPPRGFRRWAKPSLLPGLLAATRTGLTPAGDDKLALDHELHLDLQLLGERSSQDTPETGNRRARAAIGAPAEPAGRGFLARRGWFKDSRAVGSRRRTASCSLKRIWRSCALRDSHSSQQITEFPSESFRRQVILSSRRSRVLSPVLAGADPIAG